MQPDLSTGTSPRVLQALETTARLQQEREEMEANVARAQRKLAKFQTDMSKLRRANTTLETELAGIRSERASLLETIDRIRDSNGTIQVLSAEEQAEKLATQNLLATLQVTLRDTESKLSSRTKQMAAANTEKDHYKALHASSQEAVVNSRQSALYWESQHKQATKEFEAKTHLYAKRVVAHRRFFADRDLKHVQAIRKLLSFLVILWRFSHVLRARANNAVIGKDSSRSVVKHLTNRKIELGREKLRSLAENIDLKEQLQKTAESQDDIVLTSKYRHEQYKFAIKLCQEAAIKFQHYRKYALSRYSQTSTRLISGLLVLWRFNLILARELTEAKAVITALESTAEDVVDAEPEVSEDPNDYEHIPASDFSRLPRIEAVAVYANLIRKHDQVQLDYRRFVESCSQVESSQVDKAEHEEVISSLEELQTAYDGLIAEHNASLESLEKLRSDVQDRDQSLEELQKQYETLESRRLTLENDLQITREQLGTTSTEKEMAQAQVSELEIYKEKTSKDLQNIFEALDKQLKEKDSTLGKLRVQRNALQDEIVTLRRSGGQMQADLTQLYGTLRGTEQKLRTAETEMGRLIRQLVEAEDTNRAVEEMRRQTEESLRNREDDRQIVTAELHKEKEDRQRLESLYAGSVQKVCEANDTIRSLHDVLGLARQRASELETRIPLLNKEIDTLRTTVIRTKEAVSRAEERFNDSQRSKKDLDQQLREASETQTSVTVALASVYCTLRRDKRASVVDQQNFAQRHEQLLSKARRLQDIVGKLETMDRWYLDALFQSQGSIPNGPPFLTDLSMSGATTSTPTARFHGQRVSGGALLGFPSKRQHRHVDRSERRRTFTNPAPNTVYVAEPTTPAVETPNRPASSLSFRSASSSVGSRRHASTVDLSTALPDE